MAAAAAAIAAEAALAAADTLPAPTQPQRTFYLCTTIGGRAEVDTEEHTEVALIMGERNTLSQAEKADPDGGSRKIHKYISINTSQ